MTITRSVLLVVGVTLTFVPTSSISAPVAQETPPAAVDQSLVPYASAENSVRLPDGRTLHLVCAGEGSPVVILAAGGSGWSIAWNKVQPAVAETTRVCAWDRAGLGLSTPSPQMQTVDNTTTDLEAALATGGITGPYVAVGHSLGAYDSMLLADRQPSDVVGMVLVDPSVPDQVARYEGITPAMSELLAAGNPLVTFLEMCAAALRAGTIQPGGPDPDGCLSGPEWPQSYPPELRAALDNVSVGATPEAIAMAMDNIAFYASPELEAQNAKIVINPERDYGNMPLIVLSAGEDGSSPDLPAEVNAELTLLLAEKQRAHAELAALSTRGDLRIVARSSHDIPQIEPQAVIDAIDETVDKVRSSERTSE